MEKHLLKNTVDFQKIFETLPDAPTFTLLEANKVFLDAGGLKHDDVINRPLFELLPDDAAVLNLRKSLERTLQQKTTHRLPIQQYDIAHPVTGVLEKRYWLPKNTPVLTSDGEIDYIIHHVEEVTEMVQSEEKRREEATAAAARLEASYRELEQANQELDAFTYSVSHDLRTPLRAINGYSRMIIEDHGQQLTADAEHYLNTIINNAIRMGGLIDDLLTFSRFGKQKPAMSLLNMDALTNSVLSELKIDILPHATFTVHPLAKASGDSSMVRLVLNNLIANAIKYSHKKEQPLIEIGCKEALDEVTYFIKDNGAGFDMKYYDKLFGVFQRLHSSNEFEGTGVGLALTERIIKKHGGKIWAEGKVNEGAAFYFTLPLIRT